MPYYKKKQVMKGFTFLKEGDMKRAKWSQQGLQNNSLIGGQTQR